jgi:hypothetical protein
MMTQPEHPAFKSGVSRDPARVARFRSAAEGKRCGRCGGSPVLVSVADRAVLPVPKRRGQAGGDFLVRGHRWLCRDCFKRFHDLMMELKKEQAKATTAALKAKAAELRANLAARTPIRPTPIRPTPPPPGRTRGQ